MPARTGPRTGDALLQAVNDAMVAMHKRYYHRAPITAKTQLMGDELRACVMGAVYTDARSSSSSSTPPIRTRRSGLRVGRSRFLAGPARAPAPCRGRPVVARDTRLGGVDVPAHAFDVAALRRSVGQRDRGSLLMIGHRARSSDRGTPGATLSLGLAGPGSETRDGPRLVLHDRKAAHG